MKSVNLICSGHVMTIQNDDWTQGLPPDAHHHHRPLFIQALEQLLINFDEIR